MNPINGRSSPKLSCTLRTTLYDSITLAPNDIVRAQLRFFVNKRAGCLFAAVAAQNPAKYGWVHRITLVQASAIDSEISQAIAEPSTTTLSLLFPNIKATEDLLALIGVFKDCRLLFLEQATEFRGSVCLGFRARVGTLRSYVTGFGDFPFLPMTRRTPYVELTTRVKPRPAYDYVFKEAPPDVIHLADMDMRGIPFEKLRRLWDNSFVQTERILGAKPDLRSAAKTTFCIPKELYVSS